MTKALLGHVGAPDRLAAELQRLRRRVSELEAAMARLKGEPAPPEDSASKDSASIGTPH
jgi:hypothetical protein